MERNNTILSRVEQSVGELWSLLGCIDFQMLQKLFVCKDFCNYPSCFILFDWSPLRVVGI